MNASELTDDQPSGVAKNRSVAGTVVLLVVLLLVAAFLSFRALFFGFWVDTCGVVTVPCEPAVFRSGQLTGMLSPWAIFLVALPLSIVLMALRRRALWVPLAAIALAIVLHLASEAIVDFALHG